MSDLVPAEDIERVVGARRHEVQHLARAVSSEQTVYLLHSAHCVGTGNDLRKCIYSLALDEGIDPSDWGSDYEDRPVVATVYKGRLFPVIPRWLVSIEKTGETNDE